MKLRALDWSSYIEAHIAEHQVTTREVHEVVFENDNHIRKARGAGVYAIFGQTNAGRYLVVLVRVRDRSGSGFVLTARDMDKAELKRYRKAKGGR